MATIKVFTAQGVKELKCFDTLAEVPFLDPETGFEVDPFDDIAEMESDRPKSTNRQFSPEGQRTMCAPPEWLEKRK